MPPAIQSTMTASAVAGLRAAVPLARRSLGEGGLAAGERRQRRARRRAHEPAAADARVDASLLGGESGQVLRSVGRT